MFRKTLEFMELNLGDSLESGAVLVKLELFIFKSFLKKPKYVHKKLMVRELFLNYSIEYKSVLNKLKLFTHKSF